MTSSASSFRIRVYPREAVVVVACAMLAGLGRAADPGPIVIDDFTSASAWSAHPADGVGLTLTADPSDDNPALRLDVHFEGGGYAIARREVDLALPENYAFTFRVRGNVPRNHLEFKLVDASGENVWWFVHRDVDFPAEFTTFRIPQRKVQFAWGPQGGGTIDTVRAIEFAVTAGTGGKGTVWIDDLTLVPLPPRDGSPLAITATASSRAENAPRVLDGDLATAWSPDPADDAPYVLLDLGRHHEFGGLLLDWAPSGRSVAASSRGSRPAPADRHEGSAVTATGGGATSGNDAAPGGDLTSGPGPYRIEVSDDGVSFRTAAEIVGSDGGRDPIFLPDSGARWIRLVTAASTAGRGAERVLPGLDRPALAELALVPLERFGDRDRFFHAIAADARRGLYPRGILGEQSYWTVVGLDRDVHEVLVGEEGQVELWAGGPSVEPFFWLEPVTSGGTEERRTAGLQTWADVQLETHLQDGYLPIPTVRWVLPDVAVETTVCASGEPGRAQLLVRYRLWNERRVPLLGRFALAIRPFQVNPPQQFLNLKGGTTHIGALSVTPGGALLEGRFAISVEPEADRFGAAPFASGDVVADYLAHGQVPATTAVDDPFGAASAVLAYDLALAPGAHRDIVLSFPLTGAPAPRTDGAAMGAAGTEGGAVAPAFGAANPAETAEGSRQPTVSADFGRALAAAEAGWHEKLDRIVLELPAAGRRHVETMRAQLGFVLVNRAGPAIQPGVRSYARSWIRDGALTGAALLRLGHPEAARDFLDWFAPHQYENGKVPCVVDWRGADPVPEHDSSGEFIYLVAEIYRFTGDHDLATRHWPRVLAAARYLDALRHERLGPEWETDATRPFRGLLPPSISHEGYSAKPMHSYWDDFFALRGFRDAAFLAAELGRPEADELAAIATEFARDLAASIQAAQEVHDIDYVPGCADLGDFDATSTTIALSPVGVEGIVPREDLVATFERYYDFFQERRTSQVWDAYTPYELRNVGAFLRLGWGARAHELLAFFFPHQRPEGWRSWAEVVAREERTPRFLGDIPHTWVGSDYIRSFLDMFVAVAPDGRSATLGAGVPPAWLRDDGVRLDGLPTPLGSVDLRMVQRDEKTVVVTLGGRATTPPEGWLLAPPLPIPPVTVRIDGRESPASFPIRLDHAPAEVVLGW